MMRSFNDEFFRQAIKDKDYLKLKVNVVSAMLDDPTFERGEAIEVLDILQKEVPDIFEDYVELDYEERLESGAWDKRYFTKLTYWFQENFAMERVEYIKEVGQVVHKDTAEKYRESMSIGSKPTAKKPVPPKTKPSTASSAKKQENPKGNFSRTRLTLAVGGLVIVGMLLFKILGN